MAGSKSFNPATITVAARNIDTVIAAGKAAMVKGLDVIGIEATNTIKLLVTHPSPSVPGEPPGLRFGGLRLSYNWQTGGAGDRHYLDVGSDASTRRPITGEAVDYAKWLEHGTSKMAARPHLRPGMAIVAPTIAPTLSKLAEAAMRSTAAALKAVPNG